MFEFFEDQVLIDANKRFNSLYDKCLLKSNLRNVQAEVEEEDDDDDDDSKDNIVIKEEPKFSAKTNENSQIIKNEHDYNSMKTNHQQSHPSNSFNKELDKFDQFLSNLPADSDLASIPSSRYISTSPSKQTLKDRLFNIYLQENEKNNASVFVNHSTNILNKAIKSDQYNMIVLNLYDVEKGYSIGFSIRENMENQSNDRKNHELNSIETKILTYSENELLYYINIGEIPPILIDLIDRLNIRLFYDGCLIMEIRDHRRKLISKPYETHYALLQPSMQTLLADLNSITNSGNYIWTQEDKYSLESQLLLATMPSLCLNPNPIVSIMKNKLNFHKLKLNEPSLRRNLMKFDWQFNVNRSICKWKDFVLPYPFRIMKIRKKYSNDYHNFNKSSIMSSNNCGSLLNFESKHVTGAKSPTQSVLHKSEYKLPIDEMLLVKKFSKRAQSVNYTNEYSLVPIEEIILEAVDKFSINNYSRLLIKRRPFDGIYYCELSPNFNTDLKNQSQFRLGEASEAEKYIQQYLKIFTEEGRRAVTIKHSLIDRPVSEHKTDDESNIFYSTLKKPVNNSPVLTGVPFNSYFDSKLPLNEFTNDKQLHAYQQFLQQQFKLQHQQKQQQSNNEALFQQVKRIKTANKDEYKPVPLSYPAAQINPSNVNSSPRTFTNIQPARSQADNMPNTKLHDTHPTNTLSLTNTTMNKPNSLIALNLINNKSFQNQVATNQHMNIISSANSINSNTSSNNGCENVPTQSLITSRLGASAILPKTNITSLIAKQNNSTNISNNVNNSANRNANGGFVQIYVPKLVQAPNSNVPVVDSTNNSNNSNKPKFQIIRL